MANPTSSTIKEFRVPLPLSAEEYKVGLRCTTVESHKRETGGGDGVELVANEAFEGIVPGDKSGISRTGRYTVKVMYIENKVPSMIRNLGPSGSLEVIQKTWNCYPLVWTEVTNHYMKDKFVLTSEMRFEADDKGEKENIFNLTGEELAKRSVDHVDFDNDPCHPQDYRESEDPSKFVSTKTSRGPLGGSGWEDTQSPVMCCYILYRLSFVWFGQQVRAEKIIIKALRRALFNFTRQAWCSVDTWLGMSMEDLCLMEEASKGELDAMRHSGSVAGMVVR